MSEPVKRTQTVLLSTVSSDSHTWNLVFLELLLVEHGYRVINLGPCVPDDLLIRSARKHRPDAIVISSVNGHGYLDGARVIRKLRRTAGLADLPVIIGGKLGTAGAPDMALTGDLIDAGFTAVFSDAADPAQLVLRIAELTTRDAEAVTRS